MPYTVQRALQGAVNVENNFSNSNLLVALRTRPYEKESEKHACRMLA